MDLSILRAVASVGASLWCALLPGPSVRAFAASEPATSEPEAGEAAASELATGEAVAGDPAAAEGWGFAGLPLLNFTTDRGLGYGAYLTIFRRRAQSLMPGPLYKVSVGGQFYRTTRGYEFHKLIADFPEIFDSRLRLDVTLGYERWDKAWYFGRGGRTPRLEAAHTPDRFYAFDMRSLWVVPNVRFPLDGPWMLYSGLTLRLVDVGVYANSRLDLEHPTGIVGGLLHVVNLGLIVDTRDREPSPRRGVFSELSLRGSHRVLGSHYAYVGGNLTHRHWLTLLEDVLVLALRLGVDLQAGQVPFFHQHVLGGSQWVELGGPLSLRGLPVGRYRGNLTAYGSAELRLAALEGTVFGRTLELMIVPFVDVAEVWTRDDFKHGPRPQVSVGGGPRVTYEHVFVVRLDFGLGLESYTSLSDPLSSELERRSLVLGVYGIVSHTF